MAGFPAGVDCVVYWMYSCCQFYNFILNRPVSIFCAGTGPVISPEMVVMLAIIECGVAATLSLSDSTGTGPRGLKLPPPPPT